MHNSVENFLNHSLYDYDKQKSNLLKAIFPFLIIIHHLEKYHLPGIGIFNWIGIWVMYLFFAMSGYGLVISYIKKPDYINGFLRRSLPKLFIPYLITFFLFVVYRYIEGVDQIELFKTKGLFSFIPTSWFIYVLALFYIFFFVVFKYVKSSTAIKVLLTSALVIAYCVIAPYIGISHWRYDKCPAFIVGMVFALTNSSITEKFVRWHALLSAIVLLGMILISFFLPFMHRLDPYLYSSLMFLFMFILRHKGRAHLSIIASFFSSISLEMFIIQYIPIYLVMDHLTFDKSFTSTAMIIILVLLLDVIFAYMMSKIVKKMKSLLC